MRSSDPRDRRTKPVLLRWSTAASDAKSADVPEVAPSTQLRDRVVVPFVIVEHESKSGSTIGILLLVQAVA
jgi:hypothetical protein